MCKLFSWIVVVALVAASLNPVIKLVLFLLALGVSVVAEKCVRDFESNVN